MTISEAMVKLLKEYASEEMARSVHPEDRNVYARGLADGRTLLAQMLLESFEEETPVA